MADGIKLLDELKGHYQAAIFGTYNANFPFFEEVVLRTLRSHGCDHNVLLMDATQCAQSLADPELAPRGAGRLYGVVPVPAAGAFHPKFILLLGKRHSRLLLGSHNLTLSGFGLNREISTRLAIENRSTEALAQSVFSFALEWVRAAAPDMVELVEATANWAPWLASKRKPAKGVAVLGSLPTGACLWEQVRERLQRNVTHVNVVGPYFDEGLSFISRVHAELPDARIVVGVSPHLSKINPTSARQLENVEFKDVSTWQEDPEKRLVHAKLIEFQYANGTSTLISGSANPSAPAWLDVAHRNAELVLAQDLGKEDPLADELGLPLLADCPDMTAAAWEVVRERREQEDMDNEEPRARAWLAFEGDDGFRVSPSFADADAEVSVIDHDDTILAVARASSGRNGQLLVPLHDEATRHAATRLRAGHEDHHFAVVHHLHELRDRATSEKRRSLRQALLDLDSKEDGIDTYLAVIEQAIFDTDPSPRVTDSRSSAREQSTPSPGAVGVGELARTARRRQRLSTGDVGLVLDALIHKLGEGLPQDVSAAARMSEEDIDDDSEVPHEPLSVDEGRLLARRCRLKTRKLMQRMVKRLELAWNEKADAFAVVVQLVASLGLLHRLRERQPKLSWLPRGEVLIEAERQRELLKEAAVTVFAAGNGVAEGLETQHGEFSELSSAAALILWAAWTTEVDVSTAMRDPSVFHHEEDADEHQREDLLALGVLLNCLQPEVLPDDSELAAVFGEDGLDWLTRQLAWAEEVRTAAPQARSVDAGTVVQFQRRGSKGLGVVLSAFDGRAEVVDRTTGETRTYTADRVQWVSSVPSPTASS